MKLAHKETMKHFCFECDKSYNYRENLKDHIASQHRGIKQMCNQCGKYFWAKKALKKHTLTVHDGLKKFECKTCKKTFSQKGNLNTHIKVWKHFQEKTIVASNADALINDIQSKNGPNDVEKIFECDACEESFADKSELGNHLSTVHNFNNKCNVCEKELNDFKELKIHFDLAHSKKEIPGKDTSEENKGTKSSKHECKQCKKLFATIPSLKRHNDSIHKGIKRYKCDSCQLAYSDKRTLQNHNSKLHQVS